MFRSVLACLLLAVPSSTAPATHDTAQIDEGAILQVICPMVGGWSAGTAFRIGPTIYLSVNHVTAPGTCTIDGKKIVVAYASKTQDFSMVAGNPGPFLKVDCGGFVKGRKYIAIGYARGLPFETTVELVGTGQKSGPYSVLVGIFTVIPGMSGGAVVSEETGAVVGLVNVYDFQHGTSGSIALADTPICTASIS